ncbi:MAG: peptide chain release factor 1 [Planctomycetota bacterium]|jgi:peptide chain release factor 1|nr:peptide chain release factor 1 [Planctomycetota bacterium]
MSLVDTLRGRVSEVEARQSDLESKLAEPGASSKPEFQSWLRELGALQKVLGPWSEYTGLDEQINEAKEFIRGNDAEMKELAELELPELEERFKEIEKEILDRVLEDDPDADRPALVEIRAGAGGDEAALFVGDMSRIYHRFCSLQGWNVEIVDESRSEAGGFKEIVLKVTGDDAFRLLRYESGGHRVQRVPATETQGRIHTSAVTVAVMPEVEALDFELDEEELEITAMRSSGPGGQHVNKTSSAVRVIHLPTGIQVKCQEDSSQIRNKARALDLLRAKLYELERQKREAERSEMRRTQVGSGDRSQRIRTYNYPQNRATDHRLGESFSLEKVTEGLIGPIFDALILADREAKLAAL